MAAHICEYKPWTHTLNKKGSLAIKGRAMERERKGGREKSTEFLNGLSVFIHKI